MTESVPADRDAADPATAEPPAEAAGASGRRRLLRGGAALAAVGAGLLSADPAAAAGLPRVRPYQATAIPTRAELHLINRLGCGYTAAAWRQMRRAGGAGAWLAQQLRPATVPESVRARGLLSWFPDLDDSPVRKWDGQVSGRKGGWEYGRDLANYTLLRRIYSTRQVHETMTDFWSAHLHAPAGDDLAWVHRWSYDQLLRRHALGRFDDLLIAATLHPAMLLYLDNWKSTRAGVNENHGRELLELHTVGRASGYTEQMVKDSATILSGYTVDAFGTWEGRYDPDRHVTGPVRVLGFSAANASGDGQDLAVAYLRYLAHHPATARTIARKLAVRFVSDSPSAQLVAHLARVFTRSGTSITATLKALVATREFQASAGTKVRTPVEDLVATARALGVVAHRPADLDSFAHTLAWAHRGPQVYQWPRPDGPPDRNAAWASAGRMLGAVTMHYNMAGGWWPSGAAAYRTPGSWLPVRKIRFDAYVDHLCRTLHGRGSTRLLLHAACQATGLRPADPITHDHELASWLGVRLIAVLLDCPTHMSR